MAVFLNDSWLDGNITDDGGGGATLIGWGSDLDMICSASTSGAGGATGNESSDFYGGAVAIAELSGNVQLSSVLCSWGEVGTTDDNGPDDIYTDGTAYTYAFGDDETFICDGDGCTPAQHVDHLGEGATTSDYSYSLQETFYGNVYYNSTATHLEGFSAHIDPSAGCSVDLGVYSSSLATGPWTQEGLASVSVSSGEGWVYSGNLGVSMTSGLYYLFGIHYAASDCGGRVYRYYDLNNTDDPTFGTYASHWYEWNLNGWTAPGTDQGFNVYTYEQNIYTTQ